MSLGDFHYDHCLPDYSNRSTFHDSHSNISISAVISSSCVVLEGLRDNSGCLSTMFPVGQDGQTLFPPEFHSSVPTSLLAGNSMFPNTTDRLTVSNSLDCPPGGVNYNNHFFESAATEFTTPADELSASSGTTHLNSSFLTEDEADGAMIIRPHVGGTFINEISEDGINPVGAVFNRGHNFVGSEGFDFYSPDRGVGNNELSTNCWFGVTSSSTFYPSNFHVDQATDSAYQYSTLSKTSPPYQEDKNTSLGAVDERIDQCRDEIVEYSTNDVCVQNQSLSPSRHRIKTSNYQNDEIDKRTGHSGINALQKCLNLPHRNNTSCYSSPSSNHPKSFVSFTMNTSFNPLSSVSDAAGNVCGSPSNNSCAFTDSCRRLQLPCGNDIKRNTSEFNEEEKNTSDESLGSTHRHQSVRHNYAPELDVELEFPDKRQYIDQKIHNSECMYAERPGSVQENEEFVASPSCLSYNDTGRNNNVDNRVAETSTRIVTTCKTKRKHAETVESLQHHLETLDDRRKKMALSCSYLNLMRQRSQVVDEKSGVEQSIPSVVDVDHMMSSGVTVAGFKPRAIIRKRSKTATPTDVKDTEYWQKRRKNNDSARKSRESKKEKEKNFYKRALELEYENIYLQECLSLAEAELATLGHPFVPPVFGAKQAEEISNCILCHGVFQRGYQKSLTLDMQKIS